MSSLGFHPYSDYMTSTGKWKYALSSHDILIDIAVNGEQVYFPLRSLNYSKNMNVTPEHGTGTHDPTALVNQEHTYSGSFTYASFITTGEDVMTKRELLWLTNSLENQNDEGRAVYFDIYLMEVPGDRTPNGTASDPSIAVDPDNAPLGFIEALIDCKLTKSGRQYPEKGTIVSERDFVFSRRIPR